MLSIWITLRFCVFENKYDVKRSEKCQPGAILAFRSLLTSWFKMAAGDLAKISVCFNISAYMRARVLILVAIPMF